MPVGGPLPACPASPASLSTTIKPGHPPLAVSPGSVSTIKPGALVPHNTIPPTFQEYTAKTPPKLAKPLSPTEPFAKSYGFILPPPPADFLDIEYLEGGPIKPIHSTIANPSSTAPFSSSSPSEGWNNNGPLHNHRHQKLSSAGNPCPPLRTQFHGRPLSHCASSFAPTFPLPLDHDELLARFNDQFVTRSRMQLVKSSSGKKAPSTGKDPSLPPSSVHGSNRQEVFKWITLKQPTFISRL